MRPGSADFGEHRGHVAVGDVHRGQSREGRTVLNTDAVERLSQLGAVQAGRMARESARRCRARAAAARPALRAGPHWPCGSARRPDWSRPRSRACRAPRPTPRRMPVSRRRATASARSGRRRLRTPHRARCAPRPTPSRSTRHREARPRCESDGRPATGAPWCRPRPATRGAPAPPCRCTCAPSKG